MLIGIALPRHHADSLIERNIKYVGDPWRIATWTTPVRPPDAPWKHLTQFGMRLAAIGAHVQRSAGPGDRVAILANQGTDYTCGFYAAIR